MNVLIAAPCCTSSSSSSAVIGISNAMKSVRCEHSHSTSPRWPLAPSTCTIWQPSVDHAAFVTFQNWHETSVSTFWPPPHVQHASPPTYVLR